LKPLQTGFEIWNSGLEGDWRGASAVGRRFAAERGNVKRADDGTKREQECEEIECRYLERIVLFQHPVQLKFNGQRRSSWNRMHPIIVGIVDGQSTKTHKVVIRRHIRKYDENNQEDCGVELGPGYRHSERLDHRNTTTGETIARIL